MYLVNVNKFHNKSAYFEGTNKSVGKISTFLFYKNKCIGFLIKRKDLFLMFKRSPAFIFLFNALLKNNDKIYFEKRNCIVYNNTKLQKQCDYNLKHVSNYIGWKIFLNDEVLGYVSDIDFEWDTGNIKYFEISDGEIKSALLGTKKVIYQDIEKISISHSKLYLKKNADIYEKKEGIVKKAGKASSFLSFKLKNSSSKTIDNIQKHSDRLREMFIDFKDEYKKGLNS